MSHGPCFVARSAVLAALVFAASAESRADDWVQVFDGGRGHDGAVAAPVEATNSGVWTDAPADPDRLDARQRALLDGLLSRVTLRPGDDPRAPALLHETFVRVVRTRTGSEMAARFIAANARAVVEFGVIDDPENSEPTIVNGKPTLLDRKMGQTDALKRPPVVTLNQGYMNTDPTWRGPNMADTLGHEMFGHALSAQLAEKAGVSGSLNYYRGDEANAGLLGWLIGIESGGPAEDGNMWSYLEDPEAYHKNLETMMAYYAATFSVEEMKDPLAALAARRARIEEARARLHKERDGLDAGRPVIEHFINVHGMRSGEFDSARQSIDARDAYAAVQDKEFDNAESYIDSLAADWRADGAKELGAISREADSPYYVGSEQRLLVLRRRLKSLVGNREPEPSVRPASDQITVVRLFRMWKQDMKDHPEHWPE